MSELIYTFVIVLVLSGLIFWLTKKALPEFLTKQEFNRWRLVWFVIVIAAYLSRSLWLLNGVIAATCILLIPRKPSDRVIYYLVLLCTLPTLKVDIPGFGGMRFIFTLTYPRMMTLMLLLGLAIKANKPKLFSLKSDKYVVLFLALISYMTFRDNTFTNSIRGILVDLIDIFVPYFVLSRYLDTKAQLDKAFLAIMIGLAPLSLIGCLESLRHWHIFDALNISLTGSRITGYDIREGSLRAATIFKSPIVLGYVMVIGLGLLTYLNPMIKNRRIFALAVFAFAACLLSTMSRGPWVGAACMIFVYMWTDREAIKKITLWSFAAIAMVASLSLTPLGTKFLDLLPFVGTSRADTVDYRARLFEQSMIVLKHHPWFGSTTFLDTPEMESMRQGQGIIDLVNSFLVIALKYGFVGLALFVAIFLVLLLRCYFILKRIPPSEVDLIRMGRILFAIVISIMLMIATVSSIDYVPVFYWAFAGILAAYLHVTEKTIRQFKVAGKSV
ncbi:MAG: O-antigen ligase family protein [Methyloglobulus sp.]